MKKQLLALFLVFALVLGGCANTNTETTEAQGAQTEAVTTETAETEATPEASSEAETEAAQETSYPITVTDGMGQEVTLEQAPEKIVALAPNVTEVLFALGLGDKIVAASEFSDYPEEAARIETIGGAMGFDVERIAELDPDLIITNGMVDDIAPLKDNGVVVASYYPQTIEEVINQILQIGEITGTSAKAQEITNEMQARVAAVQQSVEGLEAPTVFYEVWGDPLMTAGKGSFINEMITLAGGTDVAGDAEPYSNYSVEQLVEKNPQIYLINDKDPNVSPEIVAARPGYEGLDAVKNNQVLTINPDLVTRPGPRIVEGLEQVADLIQPERAK